VLIQERTVNIAPITISRRRFLLTASLGLCASSAVFGGVAGAAGEVPVMVYKSATCGCCSAWVDYLRDNGFQVEAQDVENLNAVKERLGLTDPRLASCHTAIVDGYVVEGHVPAADIRRLLAERPAIVGLTAPGMPQLAPGMMSVEPKGYDVLSFDERGQGEVFSRY
jgi:hypothetical protein